MKGQGIILKGVQFFLKYSLKAFFSEKFHLITKRNCFHPWILPAKEKNEIVPTYNKDYIIFWSPRFFSLLRLSYNAGIFSYLIKYFIFFPRKQKMKKKENSSTQCGLPMEKLKKRAFSFMKFMRVRQEGWKRKFTFIASGNTLFAKWRF